MLFEKSLPAKTLSEVPASIAGAASTARLIEVLSRSTCRTVIQLRFERVDCSNDIQYVGRPIILPLYGLVISVSLTLCNGAGASIFILVP